MVEPDSELLLAGDQQVLIHCASGNDRTGFGSALILDVLGVPEDTIVDDYMLTNRYLPIDEEVDRIVGLEIGADDYVVKPYSVVELMARVRTFSSKRTPRPCSDW
mgnify:CR=1 FL=1